MSLAVSLSLPLYKVLGYCTTAAPTRTDPLLPHDHDHDSGSDTESHSHPHQRHLPSLAAPATCDLLATIAFVVGLSALPTSTWGILRSCTLIFVPVFNHVSHWCGAPHSEPCTYTDAKSVTLATVAAFSVFVATYIAAHDGVAVTTKHHSPSAVAVSVGAMVCGAALGALQIVLECRVSRTQVWQPLEQMGWEGVMMVVEMVCVCFAAEVIPGVPDSMRVSVGWRMVTHSRRLAWLLGAFGVCVCVFANVGMVVGRRSPVFRGVLSGCRSGVIWVVDLVLYYWLTPQAYGEPFTVYSAGNVVGIGLMGAALWVSGRKARGEWERVPVDDARDV